jgi:hypothetical protein
MSRATLNLYSDEDLDRLTMPPSVCSRRSERGS